MTHRERVIYALEDAGPCCDACLGDRTGIRPHQAVNSTANRLKKEGQVVRTNRSCPSCSKTKLVNSLPGQAAAPRPEPSHRSPQLLKAGAAASDRPWHWEGNIQARIVSHLVEHGHAIHAVANTATHAQGKDIETKSPNERTLWVSVKGFPERSANVQARHWFSQALFDVILYRDEDTTAELAIGLPAGFSTYENLSKRIRWFKHAVPFRIFWVYEDGHVAVE